MYTPSELEQMAIISIRNYLNKKATDIGFTDAELKENYPLAIKVIVNNATTLINNKAPGVSSMSQGSQSMTFKDGVEAFTITDDVKALLPRPFIKMW